MDSRQAHCRVELGCSGIVIAVGPLAQLVAHLHDAQGVVGSSPARPTPKSLVRDHFPRSFVAFNLPTACCRTAYAD